MLLLHVQHQVLLVFLLHVHHILPVLLLFPLLVQHHLLVPPELLHYYSENDQVRVFRKFIILLLSPGGHGRIYNPLSLSQQVAMAVFVISILFLKVAFNGHL